MRGASRYRESVMQLFSNIRENRLLAFLVFVLVVLAVVLGGVVLSDNPEWIFSGLGISEAASPKYEALKFLGIGMGGVLVAFQALMSYRRAKALEDTVRNTEQGQRQERLKNAIEHLGHESDSVRMGGTYELFHLAQDTKELRRTVFDILCAHIRWTTGKCEYQRMYRWKPSEEVQSLLTLLFVQQHGVFEGLHINLQGSWLNGAELSDAHLESAVLDKASLKVAILYNADLRSARFEEAQLHGAHLIDADLRGAWFWKALLFGAWLSWTDLRGASLDDARLQGARLMHADLQRARLLDAHLQGAFLESANLRAAFLGGARLQGTNLWKAQLQGAGFQGTELHGAGSRKVDAHGKFAQRMRASIGRASDPSGAILSGGLNQGDVGSIVEVLPDDPDDHAMKLREELTPHIGIPESNELPQESGAVTGTYTEEEAEQWIAEYEEAMSEVPEVD